MRPPTATRQVSPLQANPRRPLRHVDSCRREDLDNLTVRTCIFVPIADAPKPTWLLTRLFLTYVIGSEPRVGNLVGGLGKDLPISVEESVRNSSKRTGRQTSGFRTGHARRSVASVRVLLAVLAVLAGHVALCVELAASSAGAMLACQLSARGLPPVRPAQRSSGTADLRSVKVFRRAARIRAITSAEVAAPPLAPAAAQQAGREQALPEMDRHVAEAAALATWGATPVEGAGVATEAGDVAEAEAATPPETRKANGNLSGNANADAGPATAKANSGQWQWSKGPDGKLTATMRTPPRKTQERPWKAQGKRTQHKEFHKGSQVQQRNQPLVKEVDPEAEYFEPRVGDYVIGVVVQAGPNWVQLDIGATRYAHLAVKDATPLVMLPPHSQRMVSKKSLSPRECSWHAILAIALQPE